MKAHEFSVLGPLMGGFGSQAFLGCLHAGDGLIKPAVMVFLADEIVDNIDLFRKVWSETELGTLIDHVNVIGVMGIAKLDEGFARVVDYADAESLRSVYRRALTLKKPLTAAVACSIVADACMGVHYAHELGQSESGEPMIHGGIRPETLQVSFQGMTKVTGYGATTIAEIARKARGGDAKDAYTAPEQTYGGRAAASIQTDVYALGCVMYEALTGKAPFAADNDLAEAMIKDELQRRVEDEAGGVTEAMAQIVLRATRKKSSERFSSALEMRHALLEGCAIADEKAIRRFMDELFPPDTVPRATRDQMLIAAREKPPAITGRLLTEIPPELSRGTRVRAQVPTDAEVEAAQGSRVERAAPPSHEAAVTALPAPSSSSPPTPYAGTPQALAQQAPTQQANAAQPAAPAPAAPSAPPAPAAPAAADAHGAEQTAETAPSRRAKYVSPSGNSKVSAAYVSTAPAPAPPPPVVYRTPPGLLIGLGLAAGVAVALGAVMFMKGDDKQPVVIQQPPPPPPPPAPPPPPTPEPTPTTQTDPAPPTGKDPAPKKGGDAAPKATGPGTINITSDPASLAISVDGKPLGTGSATFTGPAGKHKIVGKDASQGITVTKTVTLKAGATMSVVLEAQKGRLAFDQLPDGVDVYVDGKKIGRTPLATIDLWAGPHRVKVAKGGTEVPYNITLPAGREMFITATFGN